MWMSSILIAVLPLIAPPAGGDQAAAVPQATPYQEESRVETPAARRTGPELREAVRAALRRWARPTDQEADGAAREFITLYRELEADRKLARSQRQYYLLKVRYRLVEVRDQIAARVARAERSAGTGQPKSLRPPEGKAGALAQQPGGRGAGGAMRPPGMRGPAMGGAGPRGPGFGGGPLQTPDYGQQLVDLIQTVIHPDTWEVNGGTGTIFYWRPGHALVVRQMGEVHEDIADALHQLRRAGN